MAYATTDQMQARFSRREAIALSDRDGSGDVNPAVLLDALEAASSEIDAFIGKRYALPLKVVPAVLVGLCCDIARYRMTGTEVMVTDEIRNRYKDAISLLKLLASGEAMFGEAPALATASIASGGSRLVKANSRPRTFAADTLGEM